MSANLLSILPETILTVTGIVIMLAEPLLVTGRSRQPLGWLAIFGSFCSGGATLYQWMQYKAVGAPITGFYGTVQLDAYSVFFHLLISAIVLVVLLGSIDYFEFPNAGVTHAGEYFALVCFGATGMMFMTSSVELLLVFVGLEISSISTYILAGFRKGQATASEASLKYFLLGSLATAFFLYGIALFFGATGSTAIAGIHQGLSGSPAPLLGVLALGMIVIGIGFKVSAAPFHVWTPDVYQGAPAPVVALMSTAPKAAAFAVLLRILFNAAPQLRDQWIVLIEIVAVASMFIGNLGALLQRDVKRMLAYSSIAHAGYLLVGYVCFHESAVSTVCFYAAAYAAMNVGALLVVAQLSGFNESARTIEDFTGAALRRPGLCALLAFFLLSLIGIPFTGGFFGKFYVFAAAVHTGYVWLAIVGLINSGIGCFYYLRLLAALYARPVQESTVAGATGRRVPFPAALALAATALATLFLGVLPGRVLHLTQIATPRTLGETASSDR